MRRIVFLSIAVFTAVLLYSCGGAETASQEAASGEGTETKGDDVADYDPNRGEGRFKDITFDQPLNQQLADGGQKVYAVKCASCHKLSEERLVGPGWKGVTQRREPTWIMNFVTNPEVMIDKDPELQAQLEICLVRMPNQNISDEEAKNLLEFMRQNDEAK